MVKQKKTDYDGELMEFQEGEGQRTSAQRSPVLPGSWCHCSMWSRSAVSVSICVPGGGEEQLQKKHEGDDQNKGQDGQVIVVGALFCGFGPTVPCRRA
jgi:hypothetical protein